MTRLARVGVWAASLLVSVALFSAGLWLLPSIRALWLVFLVTLVAALPAWCLFLPLVVFLRDAEGRRMGILLVAGVLIGPLTVACLSGVQLLRGGDFHAVWYGDPLLGVGAASGMVFAAIVGTLTTITYVIALKVLSARPRTDSQDAEGIYKERG
jgi:hypothetical protein